MAPTSKTRKPIDQLRSADLDAFPIWEFAAADEAIEGMDETWVQPVKARSVPPDAYSLSVSAQFRTANGQALRGIVGVSTAESIEMGHAAIITEDNYIFIPSPEFWRAAEDAEAAARALGLPPTLLFPLTYQLSVPIRGESSPRSGSYTYGKRDA